MMEMKIAISVANMVIFSDVMDVKIMLDSLPERRIRKRMSDEDRIERISGMTDEVCIHDLEAIRDYFLRETGGSCPLCLDYAIAVLRIRVNDGNKKEEKDG